MAERSCVWASTEESIFHTPYIWVKFWTNYFWYYFFKNVFEQTNFEQTIFEQTVFEKKNFEEIIFFQVWQASIELQGHRGFVQALPDVEGTLRRREKVKKERKEERKKEKKRKKERKEWKNISRWSLSHKNKILSFFKPLKETFDAKNEKKECSILV